MSVGRPLIGSSIAVLRSARRPRPAHPSVIRSVGRSVDRSVGRSIGRSVGLGCVRLFLIHNASEATPIDNIMSGSPKWWWYVFFPASTFAGRFRFAGLCRRRPSKPILHGVRYFFEASSRLRAVSSVRSDDAPQAAAVRPLPMIRPHCRGPGRARSAESTTVRIAS